MKSDKLKLSIGVFRQANVVLTHWVKEGSILIFIPVAHDLNRSKSCKRENSRSQLNKKRKSNTLVCPDSRYNESAYFSRCRTIAPIEWPCPNAFGQLAAI